MRLEVGRDRDMRRTGRSDPSVTSVRGPRMILDVVDKQGLDSTNSVSRRSGWR
jgi:hypothetical protein